MGAIHFLTAADGEIVTMGSAGGIVYTFKTVLGAPGAGNVHVKVQGSLDLTVRKLAEATRGVVDAANITYGAGTQPNPSAWGYYTSQRFSLGATPVVVGSNILFYGIIADQTDAALPLTLTTAPAGVGTTTIFTRVYTTRYVLTGNAAALGDRVAGAYQMVIPMKSVIDDTGAQVWYDPEIFVAEAVVSANRIIEVDTYWSLNEVTFVLMALGLDVSKDVATAGASQFITKVQRVPPGGGVYVKMRSDGTNPADWIDFKMHSHYYPAGV